MMQSDIPVCVATTFLSENSDQVPMRVFEVFRKCRSSVVPGVDLVCKFTTLLLDSRLNLPGPQTAVPGYQFLIPKRLICLSFKAPQHTRERHQSRHFYGLWMNARVISIHSHNEHRTVFGIPKQLLISLSHITAAKLVYRTTH